jgi:hypothetical protein
MAEEMVPETRVLLTGGPRDGMIHQPRMGDAGAVAMPLETGNLAVYAETAHYSPDGMNLWVYVGLRDLDLNPIPEE